MPLTALSFSLVAVLLVHFMARRDTFRAPRLTAVAILLLLAFPLLSLLPKLSLLPAPTPDSTSGFHGFPWHWLWLAGSTLLLARVMASGIRLSIWRRDSSRIEILETRDRPVELRSHPAINSPMAAGILKPLILVPPTWSEWRQQDRDMVLAHELAHHRRHDPLWRLLGALALALHWCNPLVWWLVRRHATLSEFACDAMVVRDGARPESYAHLLCDLAQVRATPQSTAAMSESSALKARVTRLMKPSGSVSPALSTLLIVLAILTAIIAAILQRAETRPAAIPIEEVKLRLSADPFPGEP
ncbi:MAG: M56 family metallopeptidase [Verrucomicrobiota bacterium]